MTLATCRAGKYHAIGRFLSGGLVLDDLPTEPRRPLGLPDTSLALLVKREGQFGEHAVAKQADFQKSHVSVSIDERRERMTESELPVSLDHGVPG